MRRSLNLLKAAQPGSVRNPRKR